ncbi:MAG: hypothetical protein AAGF73_08980 [Actinomycetota bacterium]
MTVRFYTRPDGEEVALDVDDPRPDPLPGRTVDRYVTVSDLDRQCRTGYPASRSGRE